MCVCVCVCVTWKQSVHHWLRRQKGVRPSGTGITGDCEPPCVWWELNSGPLEKSRAHFKKIYLFIYLFIYLLIMWVHLLPSDTPDEGIRPNYRWLRATMWLLVIDLRTSGRTVKEQSMLLTTEPSLQPQTCTFLMWVLHLTLKSTVLTLGGSSPPGAILRKGTV